MTQRTAIATCGSLFFVIMHSASAAPIQPLAPGDALVIDIGCIAQQSYLGQIKQGLSALMAHTQNNLWLRAKAVKAIYGLSEQDFFNFLNQISTGGPEICYRGQRIPALLTASFLGAEYKTILTQINEHLQSVYPSGTEVYSDVQRAVYMAAADVAFDPSAQAATFAANDQARNLLIACICDDIPFFVTGNLSRETYDKILTYADFAPLKKARGTFLSSDCKEDAKPGALFYQMALSKFGLADANGKISPAAVCIESEETHVATAQKFITRTYLGSDETLRMLRPHAK